MCCMGASETQGGLDSLEAFVQLSVPLEARKSKHQSTDQPEKEGDRQKEFNESKPLLALVDSGGAISHGRR